MRPTVVGVVLLPILLASCSGDPPSILDPAGPGARTAARLWWPMLWTSVAVLVVVGVMLVWAVVRGRGADPSRLDKKEITWGEPFIAVAGVFLPFVILAGTFVISLGAMDDLNDRGEHADMTLEVIGRDWWWEVRYPNGAVTANEIHIPVGKTVRLELTTKDVIHSFWVPELQVKTDQIPGQVNHSWLHADAAGRFRGQCAEFCGLQHANMVFHVIAEPPEVFRRWVTHEARNVSPQAQVMAGESVFFESSCIGCHAIRGTAADAEAGPDLTHFASRSTISGVWPNDRSHLERFVRDPHVLKPGIAMPPAELSDAEIELLVDYLEALS